MGAEDDRSTRSNGPSNLSDRWRPGRVWINLCNAGDIVIRQGPLVQLRYDAEWNHHGREQRRVIQPQQVADFVRQHTLYVEFAFLGACREFEGRVENDVGFFGRVLSPGISPEK